MKLSVRIIRPVFLLSLCLFVSPLSSDAQAQESPPQASTPPSSLDAATAPRSSAKGQSKEVRQQRAQAYAKILEGQRYLSYLRNGGDALSRETNARRARAAFQLAIQLDPSLAEAYTALAEMAFLYLPQNLEEATRLASNAVRIDPDNFGAHQLLSRVYALKSGLSDKKPDQATAERAIAELREVVRLAPNDAEAWALLGEFYFAMGKSVEAIAAMSKWASAPEAIEKRFFRAITAGRELTPDAAAARLGEALLRAGRPAEALTSIRRAVALNPENKDYVALLGQAIETAGDDAASISELQSMVKADPANAMLVMLLARVLVRTGRVDEATSLLRSGIQRLMLEDKDAALELRLALAQMYADAMRYQDAIAVYEEMLKERGIADDFLTGEANRRIASELLRRILQLHKSAGQNAEAAATIERMRRLLGNDPAIETERVELLRDQGLREEALQAVRDARARHPQENSFLFLEASLLTDLGRVNEGVALLRTRLSKNTQEDKQSTLSPAEILIYLRISNLYAQAGRGKQAVAAAQEALARTPPERADIIEICLLTLSSAQERAGDFKGAEETLRKVLAKDANNATALNNLGYFLVENNERLDEALLMIQRALRMEPTNSSFLDSLGWAYFKLGQLDLAERYLSEAAQRDPTSATIQEHLGDLYQRLDKMEKARAAWRKALARATESGQIAGLKAKLNGKAKN